MPPWIRQVVRRKLLHCLEVSDQVLDQPYLLSMETELAVVAYLFVAKRKFDNDTDMTHYTTILEQHKLERKDNSKQLRVP